MKITLSKEQRHFLLFKLVRTLARLTKHFNVMVRQCAYCKCLLGFKRGGKGVSHGICVKCFKNLS